MEFTAQSSDLAAALGLIRAIVPSRTTIPLLNNVKVACSRDGVTLTGTDMTMEASTFEPCEVIAEGETTVPAHALYSLMKALPPKKLATLKLSDGRAMLSCGRSTYSLGTLPADDFPSMPTLEADALTFSLPVSELVALLNATRGTTLENVQDRYFLQGICIHTSSDDLVFVATDQKRFSQIKRKRPHGFPDVAVVDAPIIPNAAVKAISTILAAHADDDATIVKFANGMMSLGVGNVKFSSRLVQGTFLDYERQMPSRDHVSFRVRADFLSDVLSRLNVVNTGVDIKQPVALVTCIENGLEIIAGKTMGDHGAEYVAAEVVEKMPSFGVNSLFLADLVSYWPSDAILNFNSSNFGAPVLITCDSLPNVQQIVMPMKPGTQLVRNQTAAEAA